jgi:hypothetical protein
VVNFVEVVEEEGKVNNLQGRSSSNRQSRAYTRLV